MTEDRRTIEWAKKYKELLREHVDALGGKAITPVRRALAESISTLQCELSMLTDRFASGGRGASATDLAQYIKTSDTISGLLQSAGLAPSQQPPPVTSDGGDEALEKLSTAFKNIVRARVQDEAAGIFRDAKGNVIADPLDIELERQIYALKQRRGHLHDAPAPLLLSPPSTPTAAPAPSAAASTPASSTPTAPSPSTSKACAVTPEEARRRAMEPLPQPVSNASGQDSTAAFYEYYSGGSNYWGAG